MDTSTQRDITDVCCEDENRSDGFFIIPDCLLRSSERRLVSFRHPKYQISKGFLLDYHEKSTYEVQLFDEENRSWFVDESVQSEGKMFIVTLYDPIFIVLPYLIKACKNVPLSDLLLEDHEFSSTIDLLEFVKNLTCIAEPVGSPDLQVWRYSKTLTMKWLKEKTMKLAKKLCDEQEPSSKAMTLCITNSVEDKEASLKLAHGIISENLTVEVSKDLYEELGLPRVDAKNKENKFSQSHDIPIMKKTKISDPVDDYSTKGTIVKTKPVQSVKAKALAKSAAGTKSISSFFKKK